MFERRIFDGLGFIERILECIGGNITGGGFAPSSGEGCFVTPESVDWASFEREFEAEGGCFVAPESTEQDSLSGASSIDGGCFVAPESVDASFSLEQSGPSRDMVEP